ncbi:MAG: TetR/AcrR family transcriptional regulator [Pseudomonadota bacterium]
MTDPASSLTRRQKVEEREQAILDAALSVFVEHGYRGARIAEIARRAGIAEGTIYIYYKTKVDLMNAIVARFWTDLTIDARDAVRGKDDTFEALRALAHFHITALIERIDVIELTQTLRTVKPSREDVRQYMRSYVAVFDDLFSRGQDRGLLQADAILWMARDVFYGTLEYSARTVLLNAKRDLDSVVENMVYVFLSTYGTPAVHIGSDQLPGGDVTDRLERAVAKVEQLLKDRE